MRNKLLSYDYGLNILLTGDAITNEYIQFINTKLEIKNNSITGEPLAWNTFNCKQGITMDVLNSFTYNYHQQDQNGLPDNIVIICVTKAISSQYTSSFMNSILKLTLPFPPFIIYSTLNNDTQSSFDDFKSKYHTHYDIRLLSLTYHDDNNMTELFNLMYRACSYYNQLDDVNTFPEIADHNFNNHLFKLNMIITGKPGVGKSTLVNILLDNIKTKQSRNDFTQNKSTTQFISKYYHAKHPLIIYDTPGIDGSNYKSTLVFIKNNAIGSKCPIKEQIHLIIYVVNINQNAVNFEEASFIKNINDMPNVPLFYLITGNEDCNTLKSNKLNFLDNYENYIKANHFNYIYLSNLIPPYSGIGLFLYSILSYMQEYPLFKSLIFNIDNNSENDVLISIRNQIFEKLVQYEPIHNQETISSPEITKVSLEILKHIYSVYGIQLNHEWNNIIKLKAKNSWSSMLLTNDYFNKDSYYIKKDIRTRIDVASYLTHLTIEAYLTIEKNINSNQDLMNYNKYLENQFIMFMENIVKEIMTKYHS